MPHTLKFAKSKIGVKQQRCGFPCLILIDTASGDV